MAPIVSPTGRVVADTTNEGLLAYYARKGYQFTGEPVSGQAPAEGPSASGSTTETPLVEGEAGSAAEVVETVAADPIAAAEAHTLTGEEIAAVLSLPQIEDTPDADDLTIADLKQIAADRGIKVPSGLRKAEIVALLNAAQEA